MRLVISELPLPVQVLTAVLAMVMLAGVVAWFAGIGRLMFRARLVVPPPEDAKLPMGEQSYRAMNRSGEFFTSPKYRIERRLVGYGALALVGSMASTFVLMLLFGQPV
jgi:hypothetical protein